GLGDAERIEKLIVKRFAIGKSKAKKKVRKVLLTGLDPSFLHGLECNPKEVAKGLAFSREGQEKIYNMVTEMILDNMKSGGLFWREPWAGGGKKSKKVKINIMGPLPVNFVTQAPYSGVNYWLLKYVAQAKKKYEVLNYMTINQVNAAGGKIKKGAKA